MRQGASIMSEDLQQMSDLLLVVELREGRLKHAAVKHQGRTIIFSTIPLRMTVNIHAHKGRVVPTDLVSPSRSLSLLFSGWIFLVSILG